MSDELSVIARWECAAHGGNLGINRDAGPLAWCSQHHDWIDAVWVEYVSADVLRGAVEALDSAHDFISRTHGWQGSEPDERDELLAEIAKHIPTGGNSA